MCRIVGISLLLFPLLAIIVSSKPIMVSFGTNQGPITPIQRPTTSRPPGRIDVANSAPAPVFERPDDIPNPSIYRALIPHQYRRKIYSHKPHPNLLLGTPVDIKYTPGRIDKRKELKRQIKALGIGYTGPQVFEKQEYEYELEKRNNNNFALRRSSEEFGQQRNQGEIYQNGQRNFVPQIGIVYSSGLRYYIPQIDYARSEEDSNSVYDRHDSRYQDDRVYQNNQQNQQNQNQQQSY